MLLVAQATLLPAVLQAQAVPNRVARAAIARPTPRRTVAVLRAPALNTFARRATLLAPLRQAPTEAAHRAEAITTEATALTVPTTEAAVQLQEAPLQAQAVVQAAATTAEAVAQVRAAQVEAAAVQAVEATAQAAEAVREAVEEDKFQPKSRI